MLDVIERNPNITLLTFLLCSLGCSESGSLPRQKPEVFIDAATIAPRLNCPTELEAPVPNGSALEGVECIPVGSMAHLTTDWPEEVPGMPFRAPVRYVSPNAPIAGDGSTSEHPLRSVPEALLTLGQGGGTIVLSRGRHAVDQPITLLESVSMQGTGSAEGSDLILSVGGMVQIQGTGVSLRDLAVIGADIPPPSDAANVEVLSGASAQFEDIRIQGGNVGLRMVGGNLVVRRISVAQTTGDGVVISENAQAILQRAHVHDTGGRGVVSDGSALHLSDSLISRNALAGVSIRGVAANDIGASSCGSLGEPEGVGALQCLSKVAIIDNNVVGLAVSGSTSSDSGPTVDAQRMFIYGTRVFNGGGDGVLVSSHAELRLNSPLRSCTLQGLGSQIVGNERSGVVASAGARISISGARISFNHGPGVFAQDSAVVLQFRFNQLQQNHGWGVGIAPSTFIEEIFCNSVSETLLGRFPVGNVILEVADGVSVSGTPLESSGVLEVRQNSIQRNSRYGILFAGRFAVVLRDNQIVDNRFQIGAQNGAMITETGSAPIGHP